MGALPHLGPQRPHSSHLEGEVPVLGNEETCSLPSVLWGDRSRCGQF